jgi:hypothetical protein
VIIRSNQIQVSSATSPTALNQSSTAAQSTFVYGANTYAATGQTSMNKIGSTRESLSAWKSSSGESDAKYQVNSYPDPSRDLERYSTLVGGAGTFADFIAKARAMDELNWNTAYTAPAVNAWLWQGFTGADTTPPTVISATFGYDTQPFTMDVKFSEDVSGSVFASALAVTNQANGAIVPFVFSSYNASTATARYTYSGPLADGNYRATILAGGVKDLSNNLLISSFSQDFYFEMADAHHDGRVNALDFNAVATNFGQSSRTFSQGDFNFDGQVNAADFTILAMKFDNSLPAATLPEAPAPSSLFSSQGVASQDRDLFADATASLTSSSQPI